MYVLYFYCTGDHLALIYIMRSKSDPTSVRIRRLLEVHSAYLFNLYYKKGKDMTLSDFPSRVKLDKSNLQKIIPISFYLQEVPQEQYYIHTRSGTQKQELLWEWYMAKINLYSLI